MGVGMSASFTVRPAVPMGHVTGVPFVVALALAEVMDARLSWPYDVTSPEGNPLARVRARAGYDDEGLFVTCEIAPAGEKDLDAGIEDAARARVDAWAADVAAGRAAAGPLAPVLGNYFDALLGMGGAVEVVRAGRVIARGTLAGVDVWGRATVRLDNGTQELELAPEQAELRPART